MNRPDQTEKDDTLTLITLDLLESTLATLPPDLRSDHLSTDHCTVANALHMMIELASGQAMYCGYGKTKIKKTVASPLSVEPILREIAHSPGVERFIRETDGAVNAGTHDRHYTVAEAVAIIREMRGRGYS